MPMVSIHLVTYNGLKYLPHCLNSIFEQIFKDWFLVIIDNASTDGSQKYCQEYQPLNLLHKQNKVKIINNSVNVGFAKGHNQALKLNNSDYVLVLNQDIILDPKFLLILMEFITKHPEVGSVAGKMLRWNFTSDITNEYLRDDSLTDIIDSTGLGFFKNHRFVDLGQGLKDTGQYNTDKELFGCSAAAAIYRREALESVKFINQAGQAEYFDEDFYMYKEDIDLAYRLHLLGWKFQYLHLALAYHDRTAKGAHQMGDLFTFKHRKFKSNFINYHSYKNHLFVLVKNVTRAALYKYGIFILAYELKKIMYLLIFERSTLLGLKDFFLKLRVMFKKRKQIMSNIKTEISF